jgi:hypothetical protein
LQIVEPTFTQFVHLVTQSAQDLKDTLILSFDLPQLWPIEGVCLSRKSSSVRLVLVKTKSFDCDGAAAKDRSPRNTQQTRNASGIHHIKATFRAMASALTF